MPESFDYRRYLLRVVRGHLRGTAASHKYAERLLKECPPIKPLTIDHLVWKFYVVALDDSVYQDSEEFLLEVEQQLTGASQQRGQVRTHL